jgi:hypothetical protein
VNPEQSPKTTVKINSTEFGRQEKLGDGLSAGHDVLQASPSLDRDCQTISIVILVMALMRITIIFIERRRSLLKVLSSLF